MLNSQEFYESVLNKKAFIEGLVLRGVKDVEIQGREWVKVVDIFDQACLKVAFESSSDEVKSQLSKNLDPSNEVDRRELMKRVRDHFDSKSNKNEITKIFELAAKVAYEDYFYQLRSG